MRPPSGGTILRDRFIIAAIAVSGLLAVTTFLVSIYSDRLEKRNDTLRVLLRDMQASQEDLIQMRDIVESKEKKIGLTRVSGAVPALEQILNGLGMEASMIRPLSKRTNKGFAEEDAELHIDGIDLNSVVNLLYSLENGPVPIKLKSARLKTAFDRPDRFTLILTASFMGK